MPAQPVDVFRDYPLDSVLGAISHFLSDMGFSCRRRAGAVGRVPAAALHTRNYFFNDFREVRLGSRLLILILACWPRAVGTANLELST